MALTPATDWYKSKQIDITDSGNVSADYQVKLTIHEGAGSDDEATGVIYCASTCSDFPNDIRFGTTDNPSTATQLSQWIESSAAGVVIMWVKLPSDGANTIYMFAGHDTAVEESSGSDTWDYFLLWDSDHTGDFTNRESDSARYEIEFDALGASFNSGDGYRLLHYTATTTRTLNQYGVRVELGLLDATDETYAESSDYICDEINIDTDLAPTDQQFVIKTMKDSSLNQDSSSDYLPDLNAYHTHEVLVTSSTVTLNITLGDTNGDLKVDLISSASIPTNALTVLGYGSHNGSTDGNDDNFFAYDAVNDAIQWGATNQGRCVLKVKNKWVAIGKYKSTEPSYDTFGAWIVVGTFKAHTPSDIASAGDAIIPAVTHPFADDANASDSFAYKVLHFPTDDANAIDSRVEAITMPLDDDANAIDIAVPAVTHPFADDANANDSRVEKIFHILADAAKASDLISFYMLFTHIINDTAKAIDSLITAVTHPFSDDANASDSRVEVVKIPLADDANASDSFAYIVKHFVSDIANASDSFAYKIKHFASDTAKAVDSLITAVTHPFADIAKAVDSLITAVTHPFFDDANANDLIEYVHPFPPYPGGTFTLYGTVSSILFPKPEWNSPDNGITKNIGLLNFRSGRLNTTDKGIETQTLTFGGVVTLYEHEANWENLAAMTTWLNGIKTAMNNGEKFTINELGSCLNGVYVINDFKFDTIPGVVEAWSWSLVLERAKDV